MSSNVVSSALDGEEKLRRRSLLSVPGADERKITKAQTLGADVVVLDLEDGVAFDRKDYARQLVKNVLEETSLSFGTSEMCVRINGLEETNDNLALRDLEAVLQCERLSSIVVPKVERVSDIRFVSEMINAHNNNNPERSRDVRILAAIESALGILNLRDIAETSVREGYPLDALIFASEDYCANIEAIRTPHATELLFARSQLVTTAKAYSLQAIDMVHIDFKDLPALATECREGRQLGFTGKQAIHPNQIPCIHQSFAPSPEEMDFAEKVVKEFEAAEASGKGACVVDGIVVDLPVYKWARKICQKVPQIP
jgi:citrate lyase subunit beta-like protein